MPRTPKLPCDDPEKSKRFIEMAQELEVDQTGAAFERALRAIAQPKLGNKPIRAETKSGRKTKR